MLAAGNYDKVQNYGVNSGKVIMIKFKTMGLIQER